MTHPADLPIDRAAAALRDGTLTAVALVEAHLDRVAQRDRAIGAFVHVSADGARMAARAADADLAAGRDRGPLHGIPFAVKDLMDVAGWPVRYGSRCHADRISTETAPVVQRMLDAGAVPLGLVATYDLGIVGPSRDGHYPQPVNPWDSTRVTGGSSSGSAAAVAAGLVRVALGTDTGGSVRSPSAYCGVVALKPTAGVLPTDGVLPLAPSLDHVGLIGRSVMDVAATWGALVGRPVPADSSGRGRTLGYVRDWFADDPDAHPDLVEVMDAAASALSLHRARIVPVALPEYAAIEAAAAVILHGEAFAIHRAALSGGGGAMGRMAYRSLVGGAILADRDVADARAAGRHFCARIDAAFASLDALIMPTVLTPAPRFAAFADETVAWTPMRTLPFNLSGHPALSVPMGFAEGLPLGMQIVGRHGAEDVILSIAAAFEATTDHGAHDPFRR